jgi:hypothetical protein
MGFNELIAKAAKNLEMMNIIDRENGLMPDEECPVPTRLRTVEIALAAGLTTENWEHIAEAYLTLKAINHNINAPDN